MDKIYYNVYSDSCRETCTDECEFNDCMIGSVVCNNECVHNTEYSLKNNWVKCDMYHKIYIRKQKISLLISKTK